MQTDAYLQFVPALPELQKFVPIDRPALLHTEQRQRPHRSTAPHEETRIALDAFYRLRTGRKLSPSPPCQSPGWTTPSTTPGLMAFLQRNTPSIPDAELPAPASTPPADVPPSSSLNPSRSRRQLGLFGAGACFFVLSSLITRRALVRRYNASRPAFYQPSNRSSGEVNGAMEAFEALNVATINVVSVTMMVTGGLLWAFDISGMDDLRRKIRGGLGVDGSGRSEKDAEEEMEEWLATVLARKDEKKRRRREGEEEERTNERGAPR